MIVRQSTTSASGSSDCDCGVKFALLVEEDQRRVVTRKNRIRLPQAFENIGTGPAGRQNRGCLGLAYLTYGCQIPYKSASSTCGVMECFSRSDLPESQFRDNFWLADLLLRRVPLPYILQRQGQGLCLDAAVAVASVFRKDKLVRIPLGGQSLGHALIGEDPVVIVVAGDEKISIADIHPDAQRLLRAVGNEGFMELPCAVRGLGVVRPLLVHEGTRLAQNMVVEIVVVPGHCHRGGSA